MACHQAPACSARGCLEGDVQPSRGWPLGAGLGDREVVPLDEAVALRPKVGEVEQLESLRAEPAARVEIEKADGVVVNHRLQANAVEPVRVAARLRVRAGSTVTSASRASPVAKANRSSRRRYSARRSKAGRRCTKCRSCRGGRSSINSDVGVIGRCSRRHSAAGRPVTPAASSSPA
jgi:hypothetical protein